MSKSNPTQVAKDLKKGLELFSMLTTIDVYPLIKQYQNKLQKHQAPAINELCFFCQRAKIHPDTLIELIQKFSPAKNDEKIVDIEIFRKDFYKIESDEQRKEDERKRPWYEKALRRAYNIIF
jgi:hypothetical protein